MIRGSFAARPAMRVRQQCAPKRIAAVRIAPWAKGERARAEENRRPKRSRGHHRLLRGSRARLLLARNAATSARGTVRAAAAMRTRCDVGGGSGIGGADDYRANEIRTRGRLPRA
jgi:hypothetical protein